MDEAPVSVSPRLLYRRLGSELAPILIDVREAPDFTADARMIVGAIRRPPEAVADWRAGLPANRPVVVYCVKGGEVGRTAAAALRDSGIEARHLEGGIRGWREAGLPLRHKVEGAGPAWVTRERPKIDRIACPWLIRRFIDPEARFLFAPTERVFAVAAEKGATAFDIPGAEPFSHDGPQCSFDAFLEVYGIADPGLDLLAEIVRGADTARLELTPQSPGLLAVSLGLSAVFADDHAMLERGMVVYDALYAWCRDCREQSHDWNPAAMRTSA
ncbi:MAG TPA: chromate resistance protein ChrB domain-containing protein [Stellaceae bacterium]|nr:chromate resistance protein ChrB domain-containing protein [Stellaceae bacterium]